MLGQNFDDLSSHVIPGLMNRMHHAKLNNDPKVVVWGSGEPMREFLYVDDMAEASLFIHNLDKAEYESNTEKMLSHVNIGAGKDITIRELSEIIKEVVGFDGLLKFDANMPDGSPRKLMDIQRLKDLGWQANTSLRNGIELSYTDFLKS